MILVVNEMEFSVNILLSATDMYSQRNKKKAYIYQHSQ